MIRTALREGLQKVRDALREAWKSVCYFFACVTKTKAGVIALIAAVMLLGVLLSYVILPAIVTGTPLLGSQEYKAYRYAKKAAKETLLHLKKFPSYVKADVRRYYGTPRGVSSCEKAWTVSGTLICENKLRMEMYADFEATVVLYSPGSYECVSFTYW